jgi:L-lactate dehydrogenase complex protein LldG
MAPQSQAHAIGGGAVCTNGAPSASYAHAGARRWMALKAICARRLSQMDAAAIQQLDQDPGFPRCPRARSRSRTQAVNGMSAFHKLIASVRSALDQPPTPDGVDLAATAPPTAPSLRRAELCSRFASELEAVGGDYLGEMTAAETAQRIGLLAKQLSIRSAAIGEGVALAMAPFAKALRAAGVELIDLESARDTAVMRDRLAACDLGIVEANYAIAATGTLAVVADARRPNSLTLLPPFNLILIEAERVLPDLAAVISALGAETIAAHRISLITGPSRTADIEKMIVLGVHGPKQLYVAMVLPRER